MRYIEFECPECHKISVADEQLAGRQVNCPHCQKSVIYRSRDAGIGAQPAQRAPARPPGIATDATDNPADTAETQEPPPSSGNSASKWFALLAVSAFVIAAIGGINFLATHRSSQSGAPTPNGVTNRSVADAHPLTLLGQRDRTAKERRTHVSFPTNCSTCVESVIPTSSDTYCSRPPAKWPTAPSSTKGGILQRFTCPRGTAIPQIWVQ